MVKTHTARFNIATYFHFDSPHSNFSRLSTAFIKLTKISRRKGSRKEIKLNKGGNFTRYEVISTDLPHERVKAQLREASQ
jgi:hypothetical protein